MALHIIDNKPVDLTDREWEMYQQICASYDNPPSQRGRDLFCDLFESDDQGIILFLKPPSKRQTTFEVIFFVFSVMQAQQLRRMKEQADATVAKVNDKLAELEKRLSKKK